MNFQPGATLATAPTLGLADTSDLGPTAGNGFYRRWPDDLATLQAHGITDVRLTLDWARLQPRPGTLDADWSEQYEQILIAAEAIGLRIWATMFDGAVPRWFDDEGGLGDDDALTTWWPRFVERVADQFGEHVAGWVPFAAIPAAAPDRPWLDTWGILGGGDVPVVAAVADDDLDRVGALSGSMHQIGVAIDAAAEDGRPTDRALSGATERWCGSIAAASLTAGVPVATTFAPAHDDPAASARLVGALVDAIDEATRDGIVVSVCFIDPGIAGPDHVGALFDTDRSPLPAMDALLGA